MVDDSLQFDAEFIKRIEHLCILSQKLTKGQTQAHRRSRAIGSGIEFHEHRPYTPGNDLKTIDWKVFGRTDKLFSRVFEQEEDLFMYFLLDCSESMQQGLPNKWNYARRVCAALSYITLRNLDCVGIAPFSNKLERQLPVCKGHAQIYKIFEYLKSLPPGHHTNLADSCKNFVSRTKRAGKVVIISDFYDHQGFKNGLDVLRYHKFEPVVIQLYDQRELDLQLHGEFELTDCETGHTRTVIITPSILRQYRESFKQFCRHIEIYCRQYNLLYFCVPIQIPFDDLILKIFRTGEFLY